MATEQSPFGYQFVNNTSSSHIGQPVKPSSRPLNDARLSNFKNMINLQDNTPGSNDSPQLYATPTRPSSSDLITHIDLRFTNLKSHKEARMISAQKLWEEVDYTLSNYTPEKSLAIFAGYSIGSKPAPTRKVEQFPKASESSSRHPVMDRKMAVPTTGTNLNNINKPSLTVHVPRCQDPYLNDMAFQHEIANFYDFNGTSKRQARYERDFTPVFKDSGVYMEENFRWEASKKSPIGSDLMDEAYDEGTLPGPRDSLNGLSSSDEHHGHVQLEFQPLSDNKRTARSPIPEHTLRELTSEEQTVQTSLALFDGANEPYVRGGTPPYDLIDLVGGGTSPYDLNDLNCRYIGHSPIRMNMNASSTLIAGSMADKIHATLDNDLSTNHHTETGNEMSTRPSNSGSASPQIVEITGSGRGDSNRPAPSIVASPSASLVRLTGADRWLSPPTPRWPHSPVSVDRLLNPPTPCWPHAHVSMDREQSPANPQWSSSPPNYITQSQHESQHGSQYGIYSPGLPIESIRSQAPKAPSEILPGLNRAANAGNSNGNNYLGADSPTLVTPWAEQHESHEIPAVPTYQAPSSPTPAPPKKSTVPDEYQFLEESNDSSTDSNVDGEPSLPVYPTATYDSSPPIPQQQLQSSSSAEAVRRRDPTKWINIAPPVPARSSSPMTDSSGFFDNGVTASFCAPPLISPTIQEIKDISPTGITQMRLSRQRARDREERATRTPNMMQPNRDLEEGRKLEIPRFNYPEHPSFYAQDLNIQKALAPNAETSLPDYGDVSKVNSNSVGTWNRIAPPQDRSVQIFKEQSFAPPHLSRQSSSFDSLNTFPPTPTDGIPPPHITSSAPSAVPNPYFIAAQHALASSVQRPSTPPAPESVRHMPGFPRLSPSTSALELTLPNEVAGTPTPARRGPGRPKKPATKRPRKSVASQAVMPASKENGGEEEGAITNEQARPTARKAPTNSTTSYDEIPGGKIEAHSGKSAFDEWKKATARKAPKKSPIHQTPGAKETETEGEQHTSGMNETGKTTAPKAPKKTNSIHDEMPMRKDEGVENTARKVPKKPTTTPRPKETESEDQQDVPAANETRKTTARKAPRKSKPTHDEKSPENDEGGDDSVMPLSAKTTARKAPRKRKVNRPVQGGGEAAPAAKKQRR